MELIENGHTPIPSAPEEMSAKDLLQEVMSNGLLLAKRQLKLAQLEAVGQFNQEKKTIALLGAAGLIAYAAFLLFLVAAAIGIGAALDGRTWAGALILGFALTLTALIVGGVGWSRRVRQPLPTSRNEIRQEIAWAKTQLA